MPAQRKASGMRRRRSSLSLIHPRRTRRSVQPLADEPGPRIAGEITPRVARRRSALLSCPWLGVGLLVCYATIAAALVSGAQALAQAATPSPAEARQPDKIQASTTQATAPVDQSDRSASGLVSESASQPAPGPWWTNRGRWTFGFQVGFALQNAIPRNISHINLLVAQPQLGLIVWDSPCSRWPARRFEILSEGFLGNAVHPGGRVTGHTLLLRFDAKPRRKFVPFMDLGAGVLDTTLFNRAPELSGRLQFTPQGGFGVQYFFRPQRAIVFEYRYMHMSNADIQLPNLGYNSSMVMVGFRWLRRPAPTAALQASTPPSHNIFRRLFGAD